MQDVVAALYERRHLTSALKQIRASSFGILSEFRFRNSDFHPRSSASIRGKKIP
jgi:hypothetical protein